MEDQELIELKNLRAKLFQQADDLITQLTKQRTVQQKIILEAPNITKSNNDKEEKLSEEYKRTLCDINRTIIGIEFNHISKRWLMDDLYQYTAQLKTKALTFIIELTVELKGNVEFEIHDIMCNFLNIKKCYMLEIESWVQTITRMKNFSLLASAISQYNERSMVRDKILRGLKDKKYATFGERIETKGGFSIHVHPPTNVRKAYLKCQWSLIFLERTWQIEHFFIIDPTKLGVKFAMKNERLLRDFCEVNIQKHRLIDLWNQLCEAVDEWEGRDDSYTDNSGIS